MGWNPSESNQDRRASFRHPATADVCLLVEGQLVEGRLIDRSATGFRLAYASGQLETGQEVEFVIGHQTGRARVAWNRFTHQHWESGLLIVPVCPV